MSRRVLWIMPFLALALSLGCNSSKPGDGKPGSDAKSKSYGSPNEVLDAAAAAAKSEDWAAFSQCLTNESRDAFAGMLVFGATFAKAFAEFDKEKGKEMTKGIDDALQKHGITEERLKEMQKDAPLKGDQKEASKAFAKLVEPVKDKGAFIADLMAALKKLGKPGQEGPMLEGELKDVKIDGDTAKGTFVRKTKDGQDKKEPIEFRKVGGSWKIQLSMDTGMGAKP